MAVRVLICDEVPLIRHALRTLLNSAPDPVEYGAWRKKHEATRWQPALIPSSRFPARKNGRWSSVVADRQERRWSSVVGRWQELPSVAQLDSRGRLSPRQP